jgi:mRNA interferase HigB
VHVISRKALRQFAAKHKDADAPLTAWFKIMRACHARDLAQLKRTFGSVDYVATRKGELHVFNIGGGKYRLIARVKYRTQTVLIRHVLTHAEYDAGKWKGR